MKQNIVVNALGEVFIMNNYVGGDVSVGEVEAKVGHKPTEEEFHEAFVQQVRDALNEYDSDPTDDEEALAFVTTVWERQKLNDGRFRINGRRGHILVCTEFKFFDDETEIRDLVYQAAAQMFAQVEIMDAGLELDHFSKDNGMTWEYGPNHDRPYHQLELSVEVTGRSQKSTKVIIKRFQEATQAAWDRGGVSVI